MKNNENDIIDIPTELKIEEPKEVIETLELSPAVESQTKANYEIKTIDDNKGDDSVIDSLINQESNVLTESTTTASIENELIATENQNQSKGESIDGNPDVLDIEVRNLEESKATSKKTLKIILLTFLVLFIASGVVFAYYKYVLTNKTDETKKEILPLQVSYLDVKYSFKDAYNQKFADFNINSKGKETSYEISNGSIKFIKGENEIYLSIEETRISAVSYLADYKNSEVIAIKDTSNNYYFAHINTELKEDLVLNYENSNLIKINADKDISNVSVANYLNGDEIFYLAIKNGQNSFINVENGEVIDISSIHLNVYNGINIDVDNLIINDSAKNKLKINGVGLFYDGSLYLYKGDIKDINEIEVKNNNASFNCEKIFVVYNEELEFFDLYVITYDKYLYKINLLNVDIDTKKLDIEKYESKISEYTISDDNNIGNSVDVIFENGEIIKLK